MVEPVTVIILVKNEEALLERCLTSVLWADEMLVLDSGSTDRSIDIARSMGATVHMQPWLGWTPQRQRGIELARNNWVMVVEADEVVTAELAESVRQVMGSNPSPRDAFAVERRDELFGRLLPSMRRRSRLRTFVRLFNRTESRYNPEEVIHETVIVAGESRLLKGLLLHWRNISFREQMRKDVDIATLEAELLETTGVRVSWWRIAAMPLGRFAWCYFAKGAWRMGVVGLVYSMMRAHSEFLRWVTLWEKQSVSPAPHPPHHLWRVAGASALEGAPPR